MHNLANKSLSGLDAEAMAEQGTDADDFAAPDVLPMSPTQALSAGFELAESVATVSVVNQANPASKKPMLEGVQDRQGFRVGELQLMVSYEAGSQLSEVPPLYRLPNSPDWFSGMVNLQGKLTPVFDMASYLGVDVSPQVKRMLLVLGHGADAVGVMIDGLPERLRWIAGSSDHVDLDSAPERLVAHLRGSSYIAGRLWFDLDIHSLFDDFESSLKVSR